MAWVYLILELNAIASIFIAFTLSVFMEDPFVGSDIVGTMYGLMGFFYFLGISFRRYAIEHFCEIIDCAFSFAVVRLYSVCSRQQQ